MTINSGDVSQAADAAADMASKGADAARGATRDAIDSLSDSLKSAREQASGLVEKIRPQIDTMTGYAKDEPVKAMLIAAASGAALMAVVSLCSRPAWRRNLRSHAASLRETAADSASDIADRAARATARASQAAQGTLESTRQAAKSAFNGVSDTAENLREKAAPLFEHWRPQFDTVRDYAKEDPGKALLIAATTGAALVGLITALSQSDD